ncbi:probable 2-carboxy-D-arabinitol-1-phosphatase, partial [Tanacetum coccineum]
PLKRSKRTAEVIWDSREEEILTDSDLREIDLYSFQGLLKHEGIAKYGEAFKLLLDLKVKSIVSSPRLAPTETANAIAHVQEAADCLGADCVPRYVETKQMKDLDIHDILSRSKKVSSVHFILLCV